MYDGSTKCGGKHEWIRKSALIRAEEALKIKQHEKIRCLQFRRKLKKRLDKDGSNVKACWLTTWRAGWGGFKGKRDGFIDKRVWKCEIRKRIDS